MTCKHSPAKCISLVDIIHPKFSLKCFTCNEIFQDPERWKRCEWE